MYLFARLTGVATYALVLMTVTYLIFRSSYKRIKFLLAFYAFILAVMAFNYLPDEHADLARLWSVMHDLVNLPTNALIQEIKLSQTPGTIVYLYLIGQFKIDGLLPGLSTLISYSFLFSILFDAGKKMCASSKAIAFVLFTVMAGGSIMSAASGIRNFLAFSMIAWCIYQECFNNKSFLKHLPLYIIGASLHTMGQVMVMYRVLHYAFSKGQTVQKKTLRILLSVAIFSIAAYYGTMYVQAVISKAETYFTAAAMKTGYSYIWSYVIGAIGIIVFFFFWNAYKKRTKAHQPEGIELGIASLYRLITPIFLVQVVLFFIEFNTQARLGMMMLFLKVPLYLYVLSMDEEMGITKVYNTALILTIIIFGIACTRGDLCSLRFF